MKKEKSLLTFVQLANEWKWVNFDLPVLELLRLMDAAPSNVMSEGRVWVGSFQSHLAI